MNVHLWRGSVKVELFFEDELDAVPVKIVNIDDRVFLLTKINSLYFGDFCEVKDNQLNLKKSQLRANDLAVNSEFVFIVSRNGLVQKIDPHNLNVIDEIVLKEDVKYCSHG